MNKYNIKTNKAEAIKVTEKTFDKIEKLFGEYNVGYVFEDTKIELVRISIGKKTLTINLGDYLVLTSDGEYIVLNEEAFDILYAKENTKKSIYQAMIGMDSDTLSEFIMNRIARELYCKEDCFNDEENFKCWLCLSKWLTSTDYKD